MTPRTSIPEAPTALTIVASMYNQGPEILAVIERLFFPGVLQNADAGAEFLLIDDASPLQKETAEMVGRFAPEFKRRFGAFSFARNPVNLGFAGSYGRGMAAARGDLVMAVNDDVYLPRGSVRGLCDALWSGRDIGAVGPVTNAAASFQNTKLMSPIRSYDPAEFSAAEAAAARLRQEMGRRVFDTDALIGFCAVYRRRALEEVGGYSEAYRHGNFEDHDLHERLRDAGWRLAVAGGVFVEHGSPIGASATFRQAPVKMLAHSAANGIRFAAGHRPILPTLWRFMIKPQIQLMDLGFTVSAEIRRARRS